MFLKEGKAYTFRKPRQIDNFVAFAEGGHLDADDEHIKDIPRRLEGMEKLKKETESFFK